MQNIFACSKTLINSSVAIDAYNEMKNMLSQNMVKKIYCRKARILQKKQFLTKIRIYTIFKH